MRNEYACFHTGLYTKRYKPIYACFGRNKKLDSLLKWCFRGFADENSALLRYISPLPEKPLYSMPLQGIHYVPDWPVRVNVEHILGDPANVARLPTELQSARNLPLLLETAVELARRLGYPNVGFELQLPPCGDADANTQCQAVAKRLSREFRVPVRTRLIPERRVVLIFPSQRVFKI